MPSLSTQAEHPAIKLRQELETYIVHKEYPDRCFITKKSIERCWPEDLVQLRSRLGLSWKNDTLLSILTRDCRVITCILAWILYEDFGEKLRAICYSIQSEQFGQNQTILQDSHLILDKDKCTEIFGFQAGLLFYDTQFMFCPVLISSTATGIHEVQPGRRWPYASPPVEIGFGAYGRVYKVAIVKGQLQVTKDSSNDNEELVAFKRVERPVAWRKEVKTLDFLKGSLSGHKRLLLHIAAFIQGSEFLIFLPYTPYGDLETFLKEGTWQDDNSEVSIVYDFAEAFGSFRKLDLAREFAAIIDATGYLHERVSSAKGLPVYCAHVDLRTKNILIFPGDTEHPAGIWHISDFGISSIKLEGGQALPEPVWSKHPSMGDIVQGRWAPPGQQSTPKKLVGPHVAPEMSLHDIFMPKESDMWSLGCIFAEILVFGLGTQQNGNRKKKLDEFRIQRCSWTTSGLDRDDYFFDRKMIPTKTENEVLVTITRRQKVDEWLKYLHNQCGELYQHLTPIADKMLQPDPRNRCTAKFASESVLTACKKVSKGQSYAKHVETNKMETVSADGWRFLAAIKTENTDSAGSLAFLSHSEYHDIPNSSPLGLQIAPDEGIVEEGVHTHPASPDTVRSFSLQRAQTIEATKGSCRTWPGVKPPQSRTVVSSISSAYGILVCLCKKQEVSNSRFFLAPRKELHELKFYKEAENAGESEAYPSYNLPESADWSELRVIGKYAIVVDPLLKSDLEKQVLIYDFVAGVEVKMPEDRDLSRMHKLTSSGNELFAAHDDKGFVLWQAGQTIFKHRLSPQLGPFGQIVFSTDGSFMFTWSIQSTSTSTLWIWNIKTAQEPQVCAFYSVPRPYYHVGRSDALLIPCGSHPACIIRTKDGTWYTASVGMAAASPYRKLEVTKQNDMDNNHLRKAALCTANERSFFFLCEKGWICACDLVWENDTTLRLVKRQKALAKSALKNPNSMVLHAKGDEMYDMIISNHVGAIESIEVKC